MSLSTARVAQLGRDLVAEQLRDRGWAVDELLERRRRILLAERDGVSRRVRVSTKRRGSWQTTLDLAHEEAPTELANRVWVFVDMTGQSTSYYVVPEGWMAEDIYREHAAYLTRHGGMRRDTPDSRHHSVGDGRIDRWLERWDVLESSE